ncbi:hypothetical protein [Planctobacterium marinum]
MTAGENKSETAQQVLIAVLPLLGTWVGTVLAFYFSKDNFEAATRSTKELLGVNQKLASILAEEVMIRSSEIQFTKQENGKVVIVKSIEENKQNNKGQRIPVINTDGSAKYVIHRSILNDYLASQALAGKHKDELEQLTLKNLIVDKKDIEDIISNFGTVKPNDTLSKVKSVMESEESRQDVFVTDNGLRGGKVVGWITNRILDENSVV